MAGILSLMRKGALNGGALDLDERRLRIATLIAGRPLGRPVISYRVKQMHMLFPRVLYRRVV